MSVLRTAISLYVPCYVPSGKISRRRNTMHYLREMLKCCSKKRRLWRELRRNPLNCAARATYRECAHTWRHLTQQHEIMLEENILRANDLGAFFKFVNKRSSNRPHISTVTTSDGITFNFPLLILTLLHALYERLCTAPLNRLPCYGALEVIVTLLLLLYMPSRTWEYQAPQLASSFRTLAED